jgi:hypothetical protein
MDTSLSTQQSDNFEQDEAVEKPNELDLEYFNGFLTSTCQSMLDLNKDMVYKALHTPETEQTIMSFICDKQRRVLLVSKQDDVFF